MVYGGISNIISIVNRGYKATYTWGHYLRVQLGRKPLETHKGLKPRKLGYGATITMVMQPLVHGTAPPSSSLSSMKESCLGLYNVVPPSYKLVYNPINYRYIYHKSWLIIGDINQLSYLWGTTMYENHDINM